VPDQVQPRRGEIWFVKLPTDPPDKGPRPVVVVSLEGRNQNPRANTVLVVPLSTTLKEVDTHVRLSSGETNLQETTEAQAENIFTVRKESLRPPRTPLRRLGNTKLSQIARCMVVSLGFRPEDIVPRSQ